MMVRHRGGDPLEAAAQLVALVRHWRWLVGSVVAGAVLAVGVAATAPTTWTSTSTLFVGPATVTEDETLALLASTADDLFPSLQRLAVSDVVLADAVARTGGRTDVPTLRDAVDAEIDPDSSTLVVRVTAVDPGTATRMTAAVVEATRDAADRLLGAGGASAVRFEQVVPPTTPRAPSGPALQKAALGGGGAAGLAAVVGLGLWARARPVVTGAGDVATVTGSAPLAVGRRRRSLVDRDGGWRDERLVDAVRSSSPAGHHGPLELAGSRRATARVRAALRRGGGGDLLTGHGPDTRSPRPVLVVAEQGITTRDALGRRVRPSSDAAGTTLLGTVVVEGPRLLTRLTGESGLLLGRRAGETTARVVACLALAVIGLDLPLPSVLDSSWLVPLALLPSWAGVLRGDRWLAVLSAVGGAALLSGVLLAARTGTERSIDATQGGARGLAVLGALGVVAVVVWSARLLPLWAVALSYGSGALAQGLLVAGQTDNPFKSAIALPLSVVVLALLDRLGRWPVTVLAIGALAALSAAADARSGAAFLLATAAIVLWQARPRSGSRRVHTAMVTALVAVLGYGGYLAGTELLVTGALGEAARLRTQTQIEQSGSLLLGGRPEWSGTWQLMLQHPAGLGLGAVPSPTDVALVKEGFAPLGIPTSDGYIEHFMTAGRFELHSVVADLWVDLGVVGLLLAGVLVLALGRGLVTQLSGRAVGSAVVTLLAVRSLWWLAFGTPASNLVEVSVTVGLCLVVAGAVVPSRTGAPDAPAPGPAPALAPTPTRDRW